MTISFILVLLGLALLDSLNPFTVAAQAYLLGTERPLPRSVAFLVATFAAYLTGGVAMLLGWSVALNALQTLVPAWFWPAAAIALGCALLLFAIWSWHRTVRASPSPCQAD
jgi:hypothetical protein